MREDGGPSQVSGSSDVMHKSNPAAQGHLPAFSVPGVGSSPILGGPGVGHSPTLGPPPAFDTHVVSYPSITKHGGFY